MVVLNKCLPDFWLIGEQNLVQYSITVWMGNWGRIETFVAALFALMFANVL
jgi:hypothetical protein